MFKQAEMFKRTNLSIDKDRNHRCNCCSVLAVVIMLVVVAAGGTPVRGQVGAAPGNSLINPRGVVFSPATGKVYSVDRARGVVDISDDAKGSTIRVRVGARPVSIAVNERTGTAYVVNSGDGTVSLIDGKTDRVVGAVRVGSEPYAIAVNSATGRVYVSRTYSDQITMIDGTTNIPTSIKTGSADFLAVDTKTDTLYLAGYEGGAILLLHGASGPVTARPAGMHLWGITVDERTETAYVPRTGSADVMALRADSAIPVAIPTGNIPCAVAINSRTDKIYVANYEDGSVTVIDGATGRSVATISAGSHPEAVAVDAVRNLVYVANTHGNSVTVIDGARNRVVATLPAGKNPYALAVNPVAGKLHVANLDERSFTILDVKNIR